MMSSTNEDEDPFLQVQQDVLSQITSTRPLFASYLRIRSLSPTPSSPELASARADLETALSTLSDDLGDLVAAVQAVESSPAQYGLSNDEVARRKRFVQEISGEIEDMRDELNKNHHGDGRAAAAASGSGSRDTGVASSSPGDDYAAQFEQQYQLQTMREQDEQLDGVYTTVGNLRRQADDMGRELAEQHEMLDLVDNTADRVSNRLQTGMKKLQHVMRQNEDRWSSCCIGVLIFVLILLLIILLLV